MTGVICAADTGDEAMCVAFSKSAGLNVSGRGMNSSCFMLN